MHWLSDFFPQDIAHYSSWFNRDIHVVRQNKKLKLLVNGSPQSGPYIRKLWLETFRAFGINKSLPASSILVLGVGGGTVIHLLDEFYPFAKITGVEIDQKMIDIGEKYFDLGKIPHLKLFCEDARTYAGSLLKQKRHFDLIIIDIFVGRHIPEFIGTQQYLRQIKSLLNPRGHLIINYLREREYNEKSNVLAQKLRDIFPKVKDKKIFLNRFFEANL